MTASTMAVLEDVSTTQEIKALFLLALYLIIPFLFLLMFIDSILFDFRFRDMWLPKDPISLMVWAVIFGFPHIVSSFITLADKEYLQFYRQKLIKGLVVATLFVISVNVIAPFLLPRQHLDGLFTLFFIIYATYTTYHLLSQQFGLGMMMMRVPQDKLYQCWRWVSTLLSVSVYLMIYTRSMLYQVDFLGYSGYDIADTGTTWLLGVVILLGVVQMRHSSARIGSVYIASNILMLVTTYAFLKLGYDIFAVMIPRFVHDLTAIMIYSVHDHNRNLAGARNYVYRALKFIPLTPLFLCFPLAIVVANGVECGAYLLDDFLGFNAHIYSECIIREYQPSYSTNGLPSSFKLWTQILFIGSFFHYYLESFVWRRDSIHRHSVRFKV